MLHRNYEKVERIIRVDINIKFECSRTPNNYVKSLDWKQEKIGRTFDII